MYLRRLAVLLAIGLVHACVFWTGDVLHTDALLGIVRLLGLRHVSDRSIELLIGASVVYPFVANLVRLAIVTPEFTAESMKRARPSRLATTWPTAPAASSTRCTKSCAWWPMAKPSCGTCGAPSAGT